MRFILDGAIYVVDKHQSTTLLEFIEALKNQGFALNGVMKNNTMMIKRIS